MKNLTTIAVSKAISGSTKAAKEARAALTVGKHEVHAVVNFDGVLTVEEDQEITPTASILNEEFLALVLHHAGITRESALRTVSLVAKDYLADWTTSKEDKKAAKAMRKAQVAKFDPEGRLSGIFQEFKATLPKIPRAGKVTFKGSVEELAMPVLTPNVEEEADVA